MGMVLRRAIVSPGTELQRVAQAPTSPPTSIPLSKYWVTFFSAL